jgi:hypothetical protein
LTHPTILRENDSHQLLRHYDDLAHLLAVDQGANLLVGEGGLFQARLIDAG